MELLHSFELVLINLLQQVRGPFIDAFFKSLNFFDTQPFIFILIPAVLIGLSWKNGLKLFTIIMLSALLNIIFKKLFEQPRPFHIDPGLAVIQVSGYGFPSGAAQTAVILSGILLSFWKNKWTWAIAANFFFWVCLSRVYLGLHFPSDLLGGWVVGGALLLTYLYAFPAIEKFLAPKPAWISLGLSLLVPLTVIVLFPIPAVLKLMAAVIGAAIGAYITLTKKCVLESPKSWVESACRMLWGVMSTFAIYFLTETLPFNEIPRLAIQYFCVGLWLSFGASFVWKCKFNQPKVECQ